jgi:hypothetical protein
MRSSTSSSEAGRTVARDLDSARAVGDARAWRRFTMRLVLFTALLVSVDRGVAALLHAGLERYYGLDAPADVLLVGHSHTMLGVDHELLAEITGLRVAKYARQGATLADRQVMIRQYVARHPGALTTIVYDVEAQLFNPEGLSRNSVRLFLPFLDEPVVAEYVWRSGMQGLDLWVRRLLHSSRFDELSVGLAVRGLMGQWSSFKTGTVTPARLQRHLDNYRPIVFDERQMALLQETMREVEDLGITFVLAYYPTMVAYNAVEPQRFAAARAAFRAMADGQRDVRYLDYIDRYAGRRDLFFDALHMNREGQRALTRDVALDLKSPRRDLP